MATRIKSSPSSATSTILFDSASQALREKRKVLRQFEDANSGLLDLYRQLKDEEAELIDKVKVLARELVEVGETKVLVDSPELTVSVVGKMPTISYSYLDAKYHWPAQILAKVTSQTIDPARVKALILTGEIDEDTEKRARQEKPNTAAVTIR